MTESKPGETAEAEGDGGAGRPKSLEDYGWVVVPTGEGGVKLLRVRRSWRRTIRGWTAIASWVAWPVMVVMWLIRRGSLEAGSGDGWQVLVDSFRVGSLILAATIVQMILWRIAKVAFWRKEWVAMPGRLAVRRGWLGLLRRIELTGGELVVEPILDPAGNAQHWRVAVVLGSEKYYVIHETIGRNLTPPIRASRAEAMAVMELLRRCVGWRTLPSIVGADCLLQPASESDEEELMARLRSRGFRVGFDDQQRLTIRPPARGRRLLAFLLGAIGGGLLWNVADGSALLFGAGGAIGGPMLTPVFWLLLAVVLVGGVGLTYLSIATFFSRERWIVDHNLVVVVSRKLYRKSEQQYVDANLKLERFRWLGGGKRSESTQLEVEEGSGRPPRHLWGDSKDEGLRLLGAVMAKRTGWKLWERTRKEAEG
jgi:hypothetical protein